MDAIAVIIVILLAYIFGRCHGQKYYRNRVVVVKKDYLPEDEARKCLAEKILVNMIKTNQIKVKTGDNLKMYYVDLYTKITEQEN